MRKDIPCGIANCPLCDKNESKHASNNTLIDCNLQLQFKSSLVNKHASDVNMLDEGDESAFKSDIIYIIDHQFALNQFDFIENCQALSNFVLPDTVLRYLNKK